MATPTRSHNVSTPKTHLPSTPNRLMASPRPGSSAVAQKSLAYKSPAVKTPASGHGHAHTVSVSSQPSSTPLGAAAIHDELLALNSPATALINSLAPSGLTPMTSGQDGLDITTNGAAGLTLSQNGHVRGDPEAQRLARLQHAMAILKTKAVGRGITRDSVERVARLQGFEALWDEDNLTIAGNIVEIEINFNPLFKDRISDLVLKLNSADGESHTQKLATDILKEEIGAAKFSTVENLESFSKNIKYLAQMDRIDVSPNAFDVAGSLYQAFRSIWDEEKKRMSWRNSLQHRRKGAIGEAYFDRNPTLGLSIDYWPEITLPDDSEDQEGQSSDITGRRAMIACEAGAPSVSASRTWLTPDVLVEESSSQNTLDGAEPRLIPEWKDDTTQSQLDIASDPKDQLEETTIPPTINVHFSCCLDPDILLPHNVALKVNNETCPLLIDQSKAMTYQTALQKSRNAASPNNDPTTIESRWSRRLPYLSKDAELKSTTHSYALYSASQNTELWVVPVSKLTFHHPRQLASAISVFRQYALVWTLLNTLVTHPSPKASSSSPAPEANGRDGVAPDRKSRIKKRSNKTQQTVTLIDGSTVSEQRDENSLPIDIALDIISDATLCVMNVFTPIKTGVGADFAANGANGARKKTTSSFLHLGITIGLNGIVGVTELTGVTSGDETGLRAKVAKMIEATEDLGVVVEWLVEQEACSSNEIPS